MLIHLDSFYNTMFSYYNMGLLYIATYLRDEGYNVKCMGINDLFYLSRDQISNVFRNGRPSIVGFYTLSDNIYQVQNFASEVKKWSPRSNTVVGGPLATSIREKILEHPALDMCIVGEGEFPMKMLADFIVNKRGKLSDIPGLIYEYRGKLVSNPPAPPIRDLDSLPYPDHKMAGVYRTFHVVSGRGCPYNCIFCFQGVHGLKYRYRSADNIINEITSNLRSYRARSFDIIDDTFISNPKRVGEIADKLEEFRNISGLDFRFFCQGRVDIMDKHPEMMEALKRAGACRIQVGIESGHPDILKVYRKRITTEQIKRVVRRAAEIGGMVIVGNFILGGPHENNETFQASVDLARELVQIAPGAFEAGMSFLGPYPGTDIAEFPENFGLKVYDDQFKKGLTLSDCHMTTEAFDVNGIRQLSPRFSGEVEKTMKKNLGRIPWDLIKTHFDWANDYWIMSQWYLYFLKKREALDDYFGFLRSARFRTLDKIEESEILEWYPQRTVENRKYSRDGRRILLPETTRKIQLYKQDEILVYELSAGKLTIRQAIEEFKNKMGSELSIEEILRNIFLPAFRKLEEAFHIVFYR